MWIIHNAKFSLNTCTFTQGHISKDVNRIVVCNNNNRKEKAMEYLTALKMGEFCSYRTTWNVIKL